MTGHVGDSRQSSSWRSCLAIFSIGTLALSILLPYSTTQSSLPSSIEESSDLAVLPLLKAIVENPVRCDLTVAHVLTAVMEILLAMLCSMLWMFGFVEGKEVGGLFLRIILAVGSFVFLSPIIMGTWNVLTLPYRFAAYLTEEKVAPTRLAPACWALALPGVLLFNASGWFPLPVWAVLYLLMMFVASWVTFSTYLDDKLTAMRNRKTLDRSEAEAAAEWEEHVREYERRQSEPPGIWDGLGINNREYEKAARILDRAKDSATWWENEQEFHQRARNQWIAHRLQLERRVPESVLHNWEWWGGWPGAFFAQQVLNHKVSRAKVRFRNAFQYAVIGHCLLIACHRLWWHWPA